MLLLWRGLRQELRYRPSALPGGIITVRIQQIFIYAKQTRSSWGICTFSLGSLLSWWLICTLIAGDLYLLASSRDDKIISQFRSVNRELLGIRLEKKNLYFFKIAVASAGEIRFLASDYNWICSYRGYYIRVRAVDHCVQDFLLKTQSLPRTQILSLGAGFDSLYFRLKDMGLLHHTVVYEVDFPDVACQKATLIKGVKELSALVGDTGGEGLVLQQHHSEVASFLSPRSHYLFWRWL